MASNSVSTSSSKPTKEGSPKRLAELLEQQQEPFILKVYLHDRGYKRKSLGFGGTSFGCLFSGKKLSGDSTRNVGLHGRRKKRSSRSYIDAAKTCSRIAKDLCNKIVFINEILRFKGCDISVGEFSTSDSVKGRGKNEKEATSMDESGRLSSVSFSTEFNSCSESDVDDMIINGSQSQRQLNHQSDQVAAERMVEWRMAEENIQCSPVSVLDEIEMISNVTFNGQELEEPQSRMSFSFPNLKKVTEDCIFSASLWELFICKKRDKRGAVGATKSSCSRHISSKKAMQQTKQLLFDCVKEAVESKGKPRKSAGHLIGTEELGKIICDKIRFSDKQSVKSKKKIAKLVRSDLLSSYGQPDDSECLTEEVVKEVGDKILEEIKDEIAEDIVDLYFCKSKRIS